MKFKLINMYCGNVELVYGENTVIINEGKSITLTEKEYESIPEYKQYLFNNGFIIVEFVEEEVIVKEDKAKVNKQK